MRTIHFPILPYSVLFSCFFPFFSFLFIPFHLFFQKEFLLYSLHLFHQRHLLYPLFFLFLFRLSFLFFFFLLLFHLLLFFLRSFRHLSHKRSSLTCSCLSSECLLTLQDVSHHLTPTTCFHSDPKPTRFLGPFPGYCPYKFLGPFPGCFFSVFIILCCTFSILTPMLAQSSTVRALTSLPKSEAVAPRCSWDTGTTATCSHPHG